MPHKSYDRANRAQIKRWQENWRPLKRFRPGGFGERMSKAIAQRLKRIAGRHEPVYPRAQAPAAFRYARRSSDPAYVARRVADGAELPPWRVYVAKYGDRKLADKTTLARWLGIAVEMAFYLWGCKEACGICLRPLRAIGEVWIRAPRQPPQSALGLDLCKDCALELLEEVARRRAGLPFRDHCEPFGIGRARRAGR